MLLHGVLGVACPLNFLGGDASGLSCALDSAEDQQLLMKLLLAICFVLRIVGHDYNMLERPRLADHR